MLRWERVYCNLLSQQIAAQMKSLCGNQKNMYRKKTTDERSTKKHVQEQAWNRQKKALTKRKSQTFIVHFCVQSFGAQSSISGFLMCVARCLFFLCLSLAPHLALHIFFFFLFSAFFVVNFPLILTDNFLLKSKLSRFPSHSIRRFRPSSCACVRVFVPWLQRLTLHFVNIPCGSVAPWL